MSIETQHEAVASSPDKSTTSYFEDREGSTAFAKSFSQLLVAVHKIRISKYLSPENTQRIRHRGDWLHPGLPDVPQSGLKQHQTDITIPYDDLLQNDLSSINRCVQKISDDMERQFAESMYSTISETCDRSGNVVDSKAVGSLPEAFAQMLEKIQFTADPNEEVHLPAIHMGPGQLENFEKAINAEPPEYHDRIEQIKAKKTQEALDRERARKAKFVRYGDQ